MHFGGYFFMFAGRQSPPPGTVRYGDSDIGTAAAIVQGKPGRFHRLECSQCWLLQDAHENRKLTRYHGAFEKQIMNR
jgi:hypothetical protein